MNDHELIARTFEAVGRIEEKIDRTEQKLDGHIEDDNRRFDRLRRKDRELAEEVEEVTGRHKALSSPDAVKAIEAAKTRRWTVAGKVILAAIALLGAVLTAHQAGRASAAPTHETAK